MILKFNKFIINNDLLDNGVKNFYILLKTCFFKMYDAIIHVSHFLTVG